MAGTHAQKSPSGAERLHACAGSLALVLSLPPAQRSGSNLASRTGTAAHFLLETCLGERVPPETYKGRLIELVGEKEDAVFLKPGAKKPRDKKRHVFEVDSTMIEGVTLAYDYVLGLLAGDPYTKVELEGKTNPLPDRDDTHGTADVTLDSWPVELHVVDYKNGRMVVEHADNPQLLAYLLGRAHEYGFDYERYKITIVQPNAWHDDGRVRTYEVTAEDLLAFEAKHRAAVEKADEAIETFPEFDRAWKAGESSDWPERFLSPGPHCDMCDAAAICPAYRMMLAAEAKIDFDEYPITEEWVGRSVTDPEYAASILRWAPMMERLIKAARAYVYAALTSGEKVADLKLVRSRSVRKWRDDLTPDQIAKQLVKEGFLNDNEVAQLWSEPQLISGPQAEKLLPNKKRKEFGEKFLVKPEGALRIVKATDPGEEVVIDPLAEFAPLEDDDE